MSTMGPAFTIDGPRPRPPRYRLLDVAEVVEVGDEHWLNGIGLWPYPKAEVHNFNPCAGGTDRVKAAAGVVPQPEFGAFTVYVTETCTLRSAGVYDLEYWKARALATLDASDSFGVEMALARGIGTPNSPYLADGNVTFPAGTGAVNHRVGLSYLADALGLSELQGIVHATPGVVEAWGELHLQQSRTELFTTGGYPVVKGGGYIGVRPDSIHGGPGGGKAWTWATGPVKVLRTAAELIPNAGPDNTWQAVDRTANLITYYAERHYAALWDTYLQAAVLIDWTLSA